MSASESVVFCEVCGKDIVGPVYWKRQSDDDELMLCKPCKDALEDKTAQDERHIPVGWLAIVGSLTGFIGLGYVTDVPILDGIAYIGMVASTGAAMLKFYGKVRD